MLAEKQASKQQQQQNILGQIVLGHILFLQMV